MSDGTAQQLLEFINNFQFNNSFLAFPELLMCDQSMSENPIMLSL